MPRRGGQKARRRRGSGCMKAAARLARAAVLCLQVEVLLHVFCQVVLQLVRVVVACGGGARRRRRASAAALRCPLPRKRPLPPPLRAFGAEPADDSLMERGRALGGAVAAPVVLHRQPQRGPARQHAPCRARERGHRGRAAQLSPRLAGAHAGGARGLGARVARGDHSAGAQLHRAATAGRDARRRAKRGRRWTWSGNEGGQPAGASEPRVRGGLRARGTHTTLRSDRVHGCTPRAPNR